MKNVKKEVKKASASLVSYSIKMVIPTGNYANIQPEIIVTAGTIEEAHDYIAPHMNKLWKEYYLCNERRPEVNKVVPVAPVVVATPVAPVETKEVEDAGVLPPSPVSSVAFGKAMQAVTSCLGLDALELIEKQVHISSKLTEEDKTTLYPLIDAKRLELNAKQQ